MQGRWPQRERTAFHTRWDGKQNGARSALETAYRLCLINSYQFVTIREGPP